MKLRFSLSNNIMIGLVLGIGCGLFFGELCAGLSIIGNAFIQLLQMCVLPYIVVSLLRGIGGLNYQQARMLAFKGGILLLFFWCVVFLYMVIAPVCFPQFETGSFFSKSFITPPTSVNYLELYIPSNPFRAMADNIVPAVVLFSICVGVALIGIKEKDSLLHDLSILGEAMMIVTNVVVNLTPIGVFAIAASAAGTMTIQEFGRMQVFLITYVALCLLMTFCVLPMLLTMVTPFRYRDVLSVSKDAMITAFTTANLFIILPIIAENCKMLYEKYDMTNEDLEAYRKVITPIIFNFPDPGKLFSLLFILFGGWFVGTPIGWLRIPEFIVSGLLSLFGSANVALPFMLTQMKLPGDLFEIYLVAGIINGRFATMLAAIYIFTFTTICSCWLAGVIKFKFHRILMSVTGIVFVSISVLIANKLVLAHLIKNTDEEWNKLISLEVKNPVKMVVKKRYSKQSLFKTLIENGKAERRLDAIKSRKVLRVGYNMRAMPFAYFNYKEQLCGYDVAMANRLAKDLGCTLEFVPFEFSDIAKGLDAGVIDIAMSGININDERIFKMNFTDPYMTLYTGLVVKDFRKDEFSTNDKLRNMKNLTLVALKGLAYIDYIRKALPNAKIIEVDRQEDFFLGKVKADAFVTSAEQGSAWTILYPSYTVVVPQPAMHTSLVAYPIAKGDLEFLTFLNYWLKLQQANGFQRRLYEYWVLGKNSKKKEPRWCVLLNVLGAKSWYAED